MSSSDGGAVGLAAAQAELLADLTDRNTLDPARRAEVFVAPPRGTLEDRWGVYTSGYVARLAEAIENDYPALHRILGDGPLRSLTARYVRKHAPRSFDIGRAGDRLAEFLENDPLIDDLVFLPDLARLEWGLSEVFVAPDVEALCWDALAALGPEQVAVTPLALRPGTAVVRSPWPIHDLWLCRDRHDDEVSVLVEGRPQDVLIYRKALEVHCRVVDELEVRLLEAVKEETCSLERFHETLGGDAGSLQPLLEAFKRLVANGALVSGTHAGASGSR